ncbi:putative neck passage structure [Lactococcus phage P008]|uniref:Putative neck passage structure n=1 Tax=Lactococcus phage P008 TaxID=83129 RepID=Q09YF7_BPLP0|nr:neck passage structure [Lactococcus phage P008]AAY97814.1 putative neck passage structure [Lactococcus phage P008]
MKLTIMVFLMSLDNFRNRTIIWDTVNKDFPQPKQEPGSVATPWMPSAGEVTVADYPKYVGFSNIIKPNKKSSDYKWLPMGLVSIDSATGSLKPAVIGIDYAQAHPVGSVVSNNSNLSSGYSTGTWENIGSAVIGSVTVYHWQRTA